MGTTTLYLINSVVAAAATSIAIQIGKHMYEERAERSERVLKNLIQYAYGY